MFDNRFAASAAVSLLLAPAHTALPQEPARGPQIEIRHARETPAPGFVYMGFAYPHLAAPPVPGLYVENRAFLSDADFKEASVKRAAPKRLVVMFVLTQEAASRAAQETESKMGQYLATLVGSRLVSASRLMSVIGRYPDIPIFMGLDLPDSVRAALESRIAARRPR